ncbi:DivIVA domain-containing protein [Frankia sp. Cppng1_Ct_nod]|uniref:DivIVA domain-containing protein n=1 Tax=Frankia sp. Cppng1_Ct_nod TaxID=2897162 RepID=UPI001041824C|nr:DivIVA domain-containing protein [Frankia sp. Cppng1_Ct_nod]
MSVFPRVAAQRVPVGRDGVAPIAFISYADEDHARHGGSINALGAAIESEIRSHTGHHDFRVFRDRREIGWGRLWNDRIVNPSDTTAILIAVMTPAFFRSAQCRHELECFLDRERHLARGNLVLPIRWADDLDLAYRGANDPLAREVAQRVPDDWPDLYGEPFAVAPVEYWTADLVGRLHKLLDAPGRASRPAPGGSRVPPGAVPRQPGPGRSEAGQSNAGQFSSPRRVTPSKPPIPPPGGEQGANHRIRYRPIVTSRDLSMKEFSATRLRTGYTMIGVDAFLDRAAAELHRLHVLIRAVESGRKPDAGELVLRVTPGEIRSTTFNPTRFLSGYCEREVDDFLGVVEREFTNLQRFVSVISGTAVPDGALSDAALSDAAISGVVETGGCGTYHPGVTGSEVTAKSFTGTRLRLGYNAAQVDEFLAGVACELDRLHAVVRSVEDGRRPVPGPSAVGLTPEDISTATFDTTWLADGYSEYEVDDFLELLEREVARVRDFLR